MPRRPGPMQNEKANNFSLAMKRLFKKMKKWRVLMIIAIMLSITSSVFSIISPNKLSDITDEITKGIQPNIKKLTKVTNSITNNLSDQKKLNIKIKEINSSNKISDKDKIVLQETLKNIQNNKANIMIEILNLPNSIKLELFDDIEIDGVLIKVQDQIETLNILKNIDKNDSKKVLKEFDKLPKSVYKLVKPKMNMKYINSIAIFLLTLYVLGAIFGYIQSFILSTVSNRFAQNLRKNISKKINKLPLKYFDNHETGDILSRITNDIDLIAQNLNNSLASLVSAITLFVLCIIMMFYTNFIMAITAIFSSIIGFALMFLILGKSQKYFNQKQKQLGELNGHIEEIYSGHSVVKAYNGEEDALKEFKKLNKKLYNSNQKSQFLSGLMPSLMQFVGNFGYVAVCVVGAILVMNDTITFGVIVAFMIYVRLFTSPLSQIAQAMSGLQSTAAASERVFEFLDEKEMSSEKNIHKRLDISKIKGNIEFKNVNFSYNPSRLIIKDFSVKVKSGQKVAIVGPTGAGKTTIVNLLMKFYEINKGDILIDNVSIKDLSRENVHKLFTMVLQDTWIFEGTIRDNIKFNRENITDREIWSILRVVGVDHFVKTLPKGLDAKIDDGDSISSGQKQLLTIARGMIKDAPFLILDEATSNVDTRTEELVQKAMDKLTIGRTSFIIAHRLSTIKNADVILVMKDGNIIEQGNHDSLIKKKGFYFDLYNSQFTKTNI